MLRWCQHPHCHNKRRKACARNEEAKMRGSVNAAILERVVSLQNACGSSHVDVKEGMRVRAYEWHFGSYPAPCDTPTIHNNTHRIHQFFIVMIILWESRVWKKWPLTSPNSRHWKSSHASAQEFSFFLFFGQGCNFKLHLHARASTPSSFNAACRVLRKQQLDLVIWSWAPAPLQVIWHSVTVLCLYHVITWQKILV